MKHQKYHTRQLQSPVETGREESPFASSGSSSGTGSPRTTQKRMPFGIRVALSWSKTSEACPGASERSWRCPLCLWAAAKWRSRTPSHPPRRKMWPGDHLGASRNEPDGLRLLGVSWQALHLLCRHCPRWSGNGLWTFGHPKPFFKEGNSCVLRLPCEKRKNILSQKLMIDERERLWECVPCSHQMATTSKNFVTSKMVASGLTTRALLVKDCRAASVPTRACWCDLGRRWQRSGLQPRFPKSY